MKSGSASPSDPSRPPANTSVFFKIFPSLVLPLFLAQVDQTVVATALPIIAGDLGGVERVSWVVICYLIAVTVSAPVYGRLGDLLGRRRLLFVALAIAMAGSAICWLAGSMEVLLIGRVIQGLGGGGLITLSQALVGEAIPARERAKYQGYLSTVGITSNSLGPVIGGLLTEYWGWRSIFLLNIPLALLAILLTKRLQGHPGSGKAFRFDFAGLFLFGAFTVSLLVMLRYVQQLDFSTLPLLLGLLASSAVAAVMLFWQEHRASHPLLPPEILSNPSVWRANVIIALHGAVLVSLVTFLPIYYRLVHWVSASETGLLLVPMSVAIGSGSIITGRLVSKNGYTAVMTSCGLAVYAVFLICMAIWSPHFSAVQISFLVGFASLFLGTVVGVMQLTVQLAVHESMIGTTAGTLQLSRALGASLGTAIIGAVLFIGVKIANPEGALMIGAILQKGSEALAGLSSAQQQILHGQIEDAFRLVFLVMAVVAALGSAIAWTLPIRRI